MNQTGCRDLRKYRLITAAFAALCALAPLSGQVQLAEAAAGGPPDTTVRVTAKGSPLRFSPEKLEVKAGQVVSVIFENSVKQAPQNWILVVPGKVAEVMAYGQSAGRDPGDYLFTPAILAGTQVVKSGEETTVMFKAPAEPGVYPYISSVGSGKPKLKGTLVVKKVD